MSNTGENGVDPVKKEGQKAEVINITIKSPDGEVAFKIKKSTKMGKVFSAYAQKKSVAEDHYRFVFDGTRLRSEQTADEAGLEDGDSIDAFVQQVGGAAV